MKRIKIMSPGMNPSSIFREPPERRLARRLCMETDPPPEMAQRIIAKAQALGASLAGFTSMAALRSSQSHRRLTSIGGSEKGETVLVLALEHPEAQPELDWWDNKKGGTPGNRRLKRTVGEMIAWLRHEFGIRSWSLPYEVEGGGVFLKDAAVLAGLGVIGKNNLLITPLYGPRVRLRAMVLDAKLPLTGQIEFAPCDSCSSVCKMACPQRALESGRYNKARCMRQMHLDEVNRTIVKTSSGLFEHYIKYCRACELACPVGRK